MKRRLTNALDLALTFATRHRQLALGLHTVIIALGCMMIYSSAKDADGRKIQLEFEAECSRVRTRLAKNLDVYSEVLESIVSLYAASNHVSRDDFKAFVQRPLVKHTGVYALEFIPRVPAEQRRGWEQKAAAEGFSKFQLKQWKSDECWVAGDDQWAREYFPVFYLEPQVNNESIMGIDLGSNPVRRKALDRAARTGRSVATSCINLVGESGPGFLLLMPMYGNGQPTHTESLRQQHLMGFAVAVFRTSDIIHEALGNNHLTKFTLQITEDNGVPLFVSAQPQSSRPSQFHQQSKCQIAGRSWNLNFGSRSDWVESRRATFAAPYIISGTVLALLLGSLFHSTTERTLKIQQQVKHRTAELEQANYLISQQKNTLSSAKLVLEASNNQLKEFAYAASHDLQTPLRGVSNYAHFLMEDYGNELDETANDYITRIIESADRMRLLIKHLLEYSQVESQQATIRSTDLNVIFRDVLQLLESEIEAAGAQITCDELPTVGCDPEQISQLFRNLLTNALKYRSETRLQIRVFANVGDMWTVSIQDNGIGIEQQFHSQIFDIFRRLHTQQEYPGTGIGLALCRRIVQRHGGEITVQSAPGQGAIFAFTIPNETALISETPTAFQAAPSRMFLSACRQDSNSTATVSEAAHLGVAPVRQKQ